MTNLIKGTEFIGNRFPPEEGSEFARALLKKDLDWDQLAIDLKGLPASLLISSFFNGFLTTIATERSELLAKARKIRWEFDHDFQYENSTRWIKWFLDRQQEHA